MRPLLITIGLSIILKDLAVILFGAENRPVPSIYGETIKIAGFRISLLAASLSSLWPAF